MELEDGLDDLLADINEPTSPKKIKSEIEILDQPGVCFFISFSKCFY